MNGQPLSGKVVTWSTSNTKVATMFTTKVRAVGCPLGQSRHDRGHRRRSRQRAWTISDSTAPSQLVAAISVSLPSPTVQTGQTAQAKATMYDESGDLITSRVPTWSSSNAAVATVTSAGLVSAVAAGTADIIATIDGRTARAALTVTGATAVPVATVNVALDGATLIVGGTTQARATMFTRATPRSPAAQLRGRRTIRRWRASRALVS